MAPRTQSKKAADSTEEAHKVSAEAKSTAESMTNSAASIAGRIENLQADVEESVFNKKIAEIQELTMNQKISTDKDFLDSSNQLKALIEALNSFAGMCTYTYPFFLNFFAVKPYSISSRGI